MALHKPNIIDALGEEDGSGVLVLSLFDEVEWTDVPLHWELLCEKLDHYMNFLTSGEFLEHWPSSAQGPFRIELVFRFPPPPEVATALERSQRFVAAHGYGLVWAVHAS